MRYNGNKGILMEKALVKESEMRKIFTAEKCEGRMRTRCLTLLHINFWSILRNQHLMIPSSRLLQILSDITPHFCLFIFLLPFSLHPSPIFPNPIWLGLGVRGKSFPSITSWYISIYLHKFAVQPSNLHEIIIGWGASVRLGILRWNYCLNIYSSVCTCVWTCV